MCAECILVLNSASPVRFVKKYSDPGTVEADIYPRIINLSRLSSFLLLTIFMTRNRYNILTENQIQFGLVSNISFH